MSPFPRFEVPLWYGAAFNVYMVNVIPVAIFGIPLVATFRAMFGAERRG